MKITMEHPMGLEPLELEFRDGIGVVAFVGDDGRIQVISPNPTELGSLAKEQLVHVAQTALDTVKATTRGRDPENLTARESNIFRLGAKA